MEIDKGPYRDSKGGLVEKREPNFEFQKELKKEEKLMDEDRDRLANGISSSINQSLKNGKSLSSTLDDVKFTFINLEYGGFTCDNFTYSGLYSKYINAIRDLIIRLKESKNKMSTRAKEIFQKYDFYQEIKKEVNSFFMGIKNPPFCYYYNMKRISNRTDIVKYLAKDSNFKNRVYLKSEIDNTQEISSNIRIIQSLAKDWKADMERSSKTPNTTINDILKFCTVNGEIKKDLFKLAITYISTEQNANEILKAYKNRDITIDNAKAILKSMYKEYNINTRARSVVDANMKNSKKTGNANEQVTDTKKSDNNDNYSMDDTDDEEVSIIVDQILSDIDILKKIISGDLPANEFDNIFNDYDVFDNVIAIYGWVLDDHSIINAQSLKILQSTMGLALNKYGIQQSDMYNRIVYGGDIADKEDINDGEVMLYAISIGNVEINNFQDLDEFRRTIQGENTKYTDKYKEFVMKMEKQESEMIMGFIQSLTARYEAAAAVAEGRNFYESDFINFAISTNEDQSQSGLKVANNIDNVSNKLNHYGFKSNRTEHEEAALKYTAFDITFKNTFNLTNPIIEKLGAQQVNLRDDLFKYGIYNQDSNTFNQSARDKYVAEKLEPIGLTSEEIEELWKTMNELPAEIEKNYEILSGNFYTDQDNFEKIAKIYALGEIIDNIKNLFKNGEVFSDNAKLGTVMGFKLDESEPADIVGDCLLLKGKVNGTETKIKYDLRTGKLYMNALTQQEFNPPKITIGNDEPNTEIGDLGNFDNLLEGYQPTSFTQTDNVDYSKSSNENATIDENGDIINSDTSNKEGNEAENNDSNQKTLEKLMENKLLEKLTIIGNTVKEKAGEQSKENNVIDEFLRTFNILPDGGNSDTIEFLGGSNLYILLESIKNTNDEDYLLKFSKLMSELMSFCGLTRGKNNLSPKEPDFDSVTIFNIDEKNATQDIISLQRANQSFFSDTDGEKDRIKGCKCHFDSSVKLSFANIIVQKCCRRYGEGWKISANHAQEFVDSVKKGIEDIKHDENDVVAMENMIEDESMWA